MNLSDDFLFLIGRLLGGVAVGAVAFGVLSTFNVWDHGPLMILGLSTALGILFFVFGRGALHWIFEVLGWL